MEDANKPEDVVYIGPYKATRLWNDVISAFRQYLPCGRHRRYMRTFDNCFSGSSAVEWLLQYLKTNRNFSSDMSRAKAVSLVNKLYKAGIFEEVKVSKSMRHKQDVQENRLYRFLPASPSKMKISRLPLAPRNDVTVNHPPVRDKSLISHESRKPELPREREPPLAEDDVQVKKPQSKLARKISILKREKSHKQIEPKTENEENYPPCHLVTRILTTREIKETWKAVFTQRLKKTLGLTNLGDIISLDIIDGYNIMHNCIYMNKSGIVTNIDAKDQLPHWVMSAMKCLARWPEPPEPGLPNYPGFEKDVFGVVKDYFIGLEEPLVPFCLYDVITNVFVMAGNRFPRHSSPHRDEDCSVPSSLWTSSSLENIILNLTKKYCLLDNTDHHHGTHEDLRSSGIEHQRYGTQEDLRFVSHLDHYFSSYNRSAFPSTDGMDKMGQSRRNGNPFFEGLSYGLASQESYPSLPGMSKMRSLNVLSKTTQSMGETGTRRKIGSDGINRKYGSTPNLKVSRYETAFGPDNLTVTRVFYQNGMTTDFGHNEMNSASLHDIASVRHKDGGSNLERVRSAESLCKNTVLQGNIVQPATRTFTKSKSVADIGSPHVSTEKFDCEEGWTSRQNTSFSGSHVTGKNHSSSFYGSSDSINCERGNVKNRTNFNNRHMNNSRESTHLCGNGAVEKEDILDQNSFHSTLSKSSATQVPPRSSDSFYTPLSHTSLDRNNLDISANSVNRSSSKHDNQPSHARISVLSSPAHFYASEEKASPAPVAVTVGHDHSQDNCDISHEMTPARNVSQSRSNGYGPGYRPTSDFYGPGYKPVLDASKERRAVSSSNLPELQHAPPRTGKPPIIGAGLNRITSTPLSPSYNGAPYAHSCYDYPPGDLSKITPFFNTDYGHRNSTERDVFMNFPQNRLSEDRAKTSLQMVCLLLPPANRRRLHLLFKMMVKMTSNPNLCLDPTQTTRSLVLSTFYQAIIRSEEESDLDELVVLQLVSFMLDFYADIFAPPSDIKTQVSERLKILQRPQIVYSPRPERTVRFCQQTNMAEYENQRTSTSQSALQQLLEGIISDKNMSLKEKKKRLKQFQRTYPTIYTLRFPNPESEEEVLLQKPKVKQPLMAKPFHRLKGLRL